MRRFAVTLLSILLAITLFPSNVYAQGEVDPLGVSSSTSTAIIVEELASTSVEQGADRPLAGQVIRVAFPSIKGISETDENGVFSGCTYDWLIEIAKYTGWRYEFVTGGVADLVPSMLSGQYDLMGGIYYRDKVAQQLSYTDYAMGSNNALLLTRLDNTTIKSYDYRTMNGATIGVLASETESIRRLHEFINFHDLECSLVPYEDAEAFERCLSNQEVDIMMKNDFLDHTGYHEVARFQAESIYFVASNDDERLKSELDFAMGEIYEVNPDFSEDLYARYFPDSKFNVASFTDTEIAFARQADTIRVAVIGDRYPLYYENEGESRGIVKGVFDLLSTKTGLTFSYVFGSSYREALDLVITGQADVMGCFMDDEYAASDMDLALTKNYATLDEVVLRNKSSAYPSDELVVAVPMGRMKPDGIEASEIQYHDSYDSCLAAVNSGSADITSMPSSYAEGLYTDYYYANITPVAVDRLESRLSVAFPQPVNAQLYSLVNKAVTGLTDDEVETILSKNVISVANRQMTIESFIYSNPLTTVMIFVTFVLLLLGFILLVVRSKVRSRIMELKLDKAVETGQAKSDFLSRMSHEIRTPMNAIIGLSTIASQSKDATPEIKTSLTKINTSAQFLLALVNDILDMSKIENGKMRLEGAPFSLRILADQMESMVGIQGEEKGLLVILDCELTDECAIGDSIRIQQVLANLMSNAFKFTNSGGTVTLSIKEIARNDEIARFRFGVRDTGIGIKAEDKDRVFESFEQAAENRKNVQGTGLGLAISSNLVKMMGGRLQLASEIGRGSEFFFTLELPVSETCEVPENKALVGEGVSLFGTRLLLAEDNDLNAEIAVALLEMEGVLVVWAINGQEAVDYFAHSPIGAFDFILMDVKMPVKDGLAATKEIRALDRLDAKTVPIIAITANTFQEDRESAADSGMDGFVPKPFDAKQLYEVLRAFCAKRT